MDPAQLGLEARDTLRLLFGAALYLLPGILLAHRLAGRHKGWLVLAPVLSISAMTLGAIGLHFLFSLPVNPATTALLALALAATAAWPLLARPRPRLALPARDALLATARAWWPALPLFLAIALVHALPHLPGDATDATDPAADTTGALGAYPGLLSRIGVFLDGHDYPYPIHVDEHRMLADAAEIGRSGDVDIPNPYTGRDTPDELFSVQGFRSERGFTLALAQIHLLTGASLPFMARVLPALWAGQLAVVLVAALRPAPGAWASGAFVAVLPTTVRMLGPGFLVPSAFALAWIPAILYAGHRLQGPARLAALYLLVTGAFLQHLVLGTLGFAVAVLATLAHGQRPVDRLAATVPVFLPLLWILPPIWSDVRNAVGGEHTLPFENGIILHPGWLLWVLTIAGVAAAYFRPRQETAPHRTLAVLMAAAAASIALSFRLDHRSDATYSRLIPTFFLCLAALAGLGLGAAIQEARARTPPHWAHATRPAGIAVGTLLAVAALAGPLAGALDTPYYRIHDEQSWQGVTAFAASGAGPDDIFLAEPWQAPLYNVVTGARPHAVLYPGSPPVNGADWAYYLQSGGADAEWLHARGITFVIAPVAPQAPGDSLGNQLFAVS